MQIGTATIQHGPSNNRVYLMKTGCEPMSRLAPVIERLAKERGYTKIFTKVRLREASLLHARGYQEEARIPGYFLRQEDAIFMSYFLDPARAVQTQAPASTFASRAGGQNLPPPTQLPDFDLRAATEKDVEDMAALYREVFPSYPFPIHDPAYLARTLRSNIHYFLVRSQGRLAAISSGEVDAEAQSSEMTDFATHPSWRGRGLASCLLRAMEKDLAKKGITTFFTIARAASESMNRVFRSAGYEYGGTLVNNTQISGKIESMNVWHKERPPGTIPVQ